MKTRSSAHLVTITNVNPLQTKYLKKNVNFKGNYLNLSSKPLPTEMMHQNY